MNQSALKEIFLQSFDTYSDAIFRFCLVKTSSKEMAEDFTQETFMRYWRSLAEGKGMQNTRSFLYTVANNLIIDWYRKKKTTSLENLQEQGYDAPDTAGFSSEAQAELKEVLDTISELEEKDKEVLLLRYVEGLEPREIAEILEESANVVSVRINRAIDKVQKKLHI
jgi:RNA polymerase sigma-70 factor, ECF subfamily